MGLDFDDGGEGEGLRPEQVEVDPDVDDDLELAEGIVPAIMPHPDDPLHGHWGNEEKNNFSKENICLECN